MWVTDYWYHFKADENLLKQLVRFVNGPFENAMVRKEKKEEGKKQSEKRIGMVLK